jgi:hypothetical protein
LNNSRLFAVITQSACADKKDSALTLFTEATDGNAWLLAAHDQIRMVFCHGLLFFYLYQAGDYFACLDRMTTLLHLCLLACSDDPFVVKASVSAKGRGRVRSFFLLPCYSSLISCSYFSAVAAGSTGIRLATAVRTSYVRVPV